MFQKLVNWQPVIFLREVKLELARVVWPSRSEAVKLTLIVIGGSTIVGAILGGLDFVLTKITEIFLK